MLLLCSSLFGYIFAKENVAFIVYSISLPYLCNRKKVCTLLLVIVFCLNFSTEKEGMLLI